MVITKKTQWWTEQGEEDLAFNCTLLVMSVILGKSKLFLCVSTSSSVQWRCYHFFTKWLQHLNELVCEILTPAKQ